ncbi:patatin-like phospholipase family protein [Alicyclobacillus tolerans]|uniref:NTE family protein n=2 Tax=Alicyclobacillus tolerans TaxID=90970 RepID=A0A1M6Q9Q5_9BACL|nr:MULTISPECIES: patatin-like phospholipase family protein [Alicyclobacillus]MDP9728450.1 NTE family protein [Alicyclobacillus tengchongensis]QRF23762.1 patatin-like phospholipase family protein [Alicyclobacillus sp. TC]SHK17009.1 NTE family protein [Alicyclobacillus montanus]
MRLFLLPLPPDCIVLNHKCLWGDDRVGIGLALGSGGAKGFAHVGVIKALEEAGITIDYISGSSMGALIAAFYATGMRTVFMEQLATTLRWRHWVDFTVPKMGMVNGEKVKQMVHMLTKGQNIEQAKIPLAIVATDLLSRQRVVFTHGNIAEAVRASIAIPGVFVPVFTENAVLVDGGVLDRVPIEAVRNLGASKVIAVDVSVNSQTTLPQSMIDVFFQSLDIMQEQVYQSVRSAADIAITPQLTSIGISQFSKAALAIDIGYQSAKAQMEEVLRELEKDNHCETYDGAS